MRKVLIGTTFGQAYTLTFGNLGLFARIAAVPFLLIVAMDLSVLFLLDKRPPAWLGLIQNVLTFIIEVPLLASWHRFVLLKRNQALPTMGFVFTPRELRFFGYLLFMMLSFSLPLFLLGAAGKNVGAVALPFIVLVVALLYVWGRLGMVFPAAAVGAPVGLAEAWRITQGNGWRIFWLTLLVGLPFAGATMVLMMILASVVAVTKDQSVLAYISVPMVVVAILFAGTNAATQSVVFRDLTDYDPETFTPA